MSRATFDGILKTLADHTAEQAYLTQQLALWRHVEKQGIDSEEVDTFSFRPSFLTRSEAKQLGRRYGSQAACVSHFNCIRLVTGVLVQIPLYPRPRKP